MSERFTLTDVYKRQDLESEFNRLVDSELEDVEIKVGVDYQALILGRFVEDEVVRCV